MNAKKTVSKIAKGIGQNLKHTVVGEDVNAIYKKTKKFNNKINKKYLKDIKQKDSYDSLFHAILPKQIKTKYVVGVGGAIGAISVGNAIGDAQDRASYGTIEGGGLSHMTSEVTSPLVSEMQEGNYDPNRVMHNSSYRDTGATGDIVLALHNRR